MEGDLRLSTAKLNMKLDSVEDTLTLVMDQIDNLTLEMEALRSAWQSGAYAEWEEEFSKRMSEWGECVNRLWQLAEQVREAAEGLVKIEQKNIWRAIGFS